MERGKMLKNNVKKSLSLLIVIAMTMGQFWSFAFADDREVVEGIESSQASESGDCMADTGDCDKSNSQIGEKIQEITPLEDIEVTTVEEKGTVKSFSEKGLVEAEPTLLEHAIRGVTEDVVFYKRSYSNIE